MRKQVWIRCFIVSLGFSIVMPMATQIIMAPSAGEEVIDLGAIDADELSEISDADFDQYMQSVPTRRLRGVERFKYIFTHPQYWQFYILSVFAVFVWFFASTLLVSYLHIRRRSDA